MGNIINASFVIRCQGLLYLQGPGLRTATDDDSDYSDWLAADMLFAHSIWQGLYSGMYSVNKKGMVPKPEKECLGQWIVEDMNILRDFRESILTHYFKTEVSQYEKAWFSLGDLMFKNFDECHFKAVMEDVHAYCQTQVEDETDDRNAEPRQISACSGRLVMSHMQK